MATKSTFEEDIQPREASRITLVDKRAMNRESAVDQLLGTIESEARKRRRRRYWYKAGAVALVAMVGLVAYVLEGKLRFKIGYYWLSLAAVAVYEILATRRERKAARQLAELDDSRAVGPLIDALELQGDTFSDRSTIAAIKESLTRLLPEHKSELTERQLNILADQVLATEDNPDVITGILRTIERHKHIEAIDAVKPWIDESPDGIEPGEIHRAAESCLRTLESESARRKAAETLLRPSEPVGDDRLLRAATSQSTESENLLRPH